MDELIRARGNELGDWRPGHVFENTEFRRISGHVIP
jgi:hypothetical protein